jgi:U6 snRNA-associated Sm-like protein LSm8
MSGGLETFVNKNVMTLTLDGRLIYGLLVSIDQTTNIVLRNASESISEGENIELGVYLIRGDNLMTCAEYDTEQPANNI